MEEKYGTRFFSPLLPGFTKKLLVPQELIKDYNLMGEDRKTAAIVTSNGKIWHINFYTELGDTYIGGTGWENFVKAHHLRDFDLLVFRYRGNMVFSIRIFDKITCCEKKYPFDSHRGAEKNRTFSENEDDGTSSKSLVLLYVNISLIRGLLSHTHTLFLQVLSSKYADVVQEKPTKPSCKKRKFQEMSHTYAHDQVPAKMERGYSRKLSFEGIIKASDKGTHMYVPATFTKSTGLDKLSEVTLIDPKNRRWSVGVRHFDKGKYSKISRGWRQFAVNNDLQEGDKCIFEAIPEKSSTELQVHILKR